MELKTMNHMVRTLRGLQDSACQELPYLGRVINLTHSEMGGQYTRNKGPSSASKLSILIRRWNDEAPFCIGGTEKIGSTKFTLKVGDKNISCGTIDSISLDNLLESSKPAPYGDLKRKKTVLDPSVRKALECGPFEIVGRSQYGGVSYLREIAKSIKKSLVGGHLLKLVPYKVNIYGPGDCFKAHTDSPKDPNMIATLVVCLPYEHEGGSLVVRQDDVEQKFDFGVKSNDSSIVQWAAFFGDCEHEVLPVLSGHRITLTYSVVVNEAKIRQHRFVSYVDSSDDDEDNGDDDEVDDEEDYDEEDDDNEYKVEKRESYKVAKYETDENANLQNQPSGNMKSLIQDASGKSKYFGIILRHRYTLSTCAPQFLKGADLKLYERLVEEFHVEALKMEPIIVKLHCSSYAGMDIHESGHFDATVYRLTEAFFDPNAATKVVTEEKKEDDATFIVPWPEKMNYSSLLEDKSSGGHTGNEYEPNEYIGYYSLAAIVVRL